MASIEFVTLEVADPTAANRFYTTVFGLDTLVRLQALEAPTTGFRGFTMSLGVSQPADVNALLGAALDAGATPLKPAAKSLWGYGGVVQAPDATIWTVASSAKQGHRPGPGRSTRSCSSWKSRMWPRASGSTLTAALPWQRAMAGGMSSSTLRRVPSS
jgi:hypothetical protein